MGAIHSSAHFAGPGSPPDRKCEYELKTLADPNVIPRIWVEKLSNNYGCPVYCVVNDSWNFGGVSWISLASANVGVWLKDWPCKADTEGR